MKIKKSSLLKMVSSPAVVEKDWITKSGLRAVVVKQAGPLFHRCGYAGVAKDSGLFGIEYNEIHEHIYVHGGLTFSGDLRVVKSNLHWFGYDCAHASDKNYANPGGIERSLEFCVGECEKLSKQLADSPLALFYKWKRQGMLLEAEHKSMLAFGIRDPQNPFVKEYFESKV